MSLEPSCPTSASLARVDEPYTLAAALWHCFAQLPALEREAWVRCMWHGNAPQRVAEQLRMDLSGLADTLRMVARTLDAALGAPAVGHLSAGLVAGHQCDDATAAGPHALRLERLLRPGRRRRMPRARAVHEPASPATNRAASLHH